MESRISKSVGDPDPKISRGRRGGGGHPDPEIRWGQSPKILFRTLGPRFGLKIRGGPPLYPPLQAEAFLAFRSSISLHDTYLLTCYLRFLYEFSSDFLPDFLSDFVSDLIGHEIG